MSEERSAWWDGCKGLAVIAVVIIHAVGDAHGFAEFGSNWLFGVFTRLAMCFAVPLFLALAGYFAVSVQDMPAGRWIIHRLTRIVPPYLVWSTITIALFHPEHLDDPAQLLLEYATGNGLYIGYFVIVLVQFTIVTPWLYRLESRRAHLAILVVMTGMGMAYAYGVKFLFPDLSLAHDPGFSLPLFAWSPYYHFGIMARKFGLGTGFDSRTHIPALTAALFVAYVLSVAESLVLSHWAGGALALVQTRLGNLVYASVMVFLLFQIGNTAPTAQMPSPLIWLGRRSYAFYLTHLPILLMIRPSLIHTNLYSNQPAYTAALTALTLLASALFIHAAENTVPKAWLRYGMGHNEPVR